jgi:hypothetical protein
MLTGSLSMGGHAAQPLHVLLDGRLVRALQLEAEVEQLVADRLVVHRSPPVVTIAGPSPGVLG